MTTSTKKSIFFLSFFFLLCAGFMYYYFKNYKEVRPDDGKLRIIGNSKVGKFSFTSQEGKIVTDDDVRGKVRVIEYFFTTCKGICPKMNENLAKVYEHYRHDDRVLLMSHTVDPKNDTMNAMMAYSKKFNADPKHWLFLTGEKQQLYNMARYSYLISAQDDTAGVTIDKDFIHDNHFVLVDKDDNIRGYYDGLENEEVTKLIADVKKLLDEK